MFYLPTTEQQLRFGDILQQQTTLSADISTKSHHVDSNKVRVEVIKPKYSVVLTPCCSIDNEIIVLSPLIPVNVNLPNRNPYLAEDLKRINNVMTAEQATPPSRWLSYTPEEKEEKSAEGLTYACVELFIYDEHPLLERYPVKWAVEGGFEDKMIGFYMIDFRNVTITTSKNIKSKEQGLFISNKIAQLTIETRTQLREKISDYYGRSPKEDLIED